MSNDSSQPEKYTATLLLNDAKQLAGALASVKNGRILLQPAKPEDETGNTTVATATAGSRGILTLHPRTGESGLPEAVPVTIIVHNKSGITLEFDAGDEVLAEQYRDVLSGRFKSSKVLDVETSMATARNRVTDAFKPAAYEARSKPLQRSPLAMGVTAQYAALLDTLQRESLEELELALPPFLEDLTAFMMGLSSHEKFGRLGHNEIHDAAIKLARNSNGIAAEILQQLQDYYLDLTPPESDDQLWQYSIGSDSRELNIIALEEFEEFLAIDRMVSVGEELYRLQLEALTLRVAELIGADPNAVRVPVHVRQICRAFQASLLEYGVPQEALAHIFDYFAKRFIRQLSGFYNPLNTLLAEQGVLSNVEVEIQSKGYILKCNKPAAALERKVQTKRIRRRHPGTGEFYDTMAQVDADGRPYSPNGEMDQFHRDLGQQLSGAMQQVNPTALYRSVVDALNYKREAEGLADGKDLASGSALSGTWEGGTVASTELDQSNLADAQSIASALSNLQRNAQARKDVQQSDSLRAYLASHKQDIGGLKNSSGLTADSLNQLDMVDNLFGTIKSQLDVSAELKPALGNLQIPLAKMALLDPRFFVDQSHTARAVVNKLSHLAASANFPNKALEGRINKIVDEIIADYESDASVFDTALSRIDGLVAQQERALARNIERVVRTQEGQEKLADARRAVEKQISWRIKPPAAPKIIVELIDSGWRDLLVLTHVKEGPKSDSWSEQIKILDLLALWLGEQQLGEVDGDVMIQRSLEAEPLLDLIGQQISSALPTHLDHELVLVQLAEIFAGNLAVETITIDETTLDVNADPELRRAKIEDLPRLRRWVHRVEQLEENSWLTYRDKNDNKKRMQLAWTSPAKDRYIFVNERGQKVADLTAIQLARQLSRGAKPPSPTDKLSVVDQSMYQTLEHVQKTLSFARNHDTLTKLINRETFVDQMSRALRHSQRKQTRHAVLYLNIDQFNLVNEVYDTITGDQVLLEFARLLAQLHGKKSSSARLDGDEFAVLLLDRSITQAMDIAEKIRTDIESGSMDIDGEHVSFTVSVGVLAIAEHSPGVDQLMDNARSAMLHAKHLGRNQVVQFEEELSTASDFRLEKNRMREDLENALATERFLLRAQPIVQTAVADREETSQHYELLLSIFNKDGSLSSPLEFIQSAERYGFMPLVDRWVVREAFSWISSLMDAQKVVPYLAINLSGTSVTDDSFMEYLLEQISEFGVGTSRLCFEITETGTISNLVKAADFVRAFRNIGCKFSIDDFGTGLASHNYLRELPVDYVKIDGSFITGIHKNRHDYAMTRSINDLAHFLGQETIAESVENDAIVRKLEEIGVDYLQGWGVGKPKPLDEVTADLANLEK
ncbi:MAG: diguanylate cyclase (GGDEF)-like protein [Halioglobus sp.]|jgi:diguanylate cyclase (GGDEF)-like protein